MNNVYFVVFNFNFNLVHILPANVIISVLECRMDVLKRGKCPSAELCR